MALVMLAAVFGGGCSSSESSTNSDALRVRVADGELNYVFGSLIETVDEESRGVSALMQRYWTRFAITGDPDADADPPWPVFDPTRGNRLNLNAAPSVVEGFREERCAWWKGYYDSLFE